jgi:prepilin peptidase CpaA
MRGRDSSYANRETATIRAASRLPIFVFNDGHTMPPDRSPPNLKKNMLQLDTLAALLVKLFANPGNAALIVLLVSAAVLDCRTGRIPNWLTVGGMATGLLCNAAAHGFVPGFLPALAGLTVGLVLLLPLYVLRVMGAGDVKLMAAVGALLMAPAILYAVTCTFVAGGVAALLYALHNRATQRMTRNVVEIVHHMAFASMTGVPPTAAKPTRGSVGNLPYAVSIAVGTVGWLVASVAGRA